MGHGYRLANKQAKADLDAFGRVRFHLDGRGRVIRTAPVDLPTPQQVAKRLGVRQVEAVKVALTDTTVTVSSRPMDYSFAGVFRENVGYSLHDRDVFEFAGDPTFMLSGRSVFKLTAFGLAVAEACRDL